MQHQKKNQLICFRFFKCLTCFCVYSYSYQTPLPCVQVQWSDFVNENEEGKFFQLNLTAPDVNSPI